MSNPLIESRIRDIRRKAAARQQRREQQAADLTEREQVSQHVSPRDLENAAKAKAAWDEVCRRDDERQARERAEQRNRDIETMAEIKKTWDTTHRPDLVAEYGRLYRRHCPGTTDAMILQYWLSQERAAKTAKIFEATK